MRAIVPSMVFSLVLVIGAAVASAQVPPDVVEMVDGGVVRGTIVENVPGDHVTIQLVTGEIRVLPSGTVLRVTMGAAPPPPRYDAPPPSEPEARVRVTATSPGLTLHRLTGTATVTVWTGNGVGGALIDQFAPICGVPCDTTLPWGTYTFGVSSGVGNPQRAGASTFVIDRDMALELEYESREGIRIGGWVLFAVGTGAYLGVSLAPILTGDNDWPLYLMAGSIGYVVLMIPAIVMIAMGDHADVHELGEGVIRF